MFSIEQVADHVIALSPGGLTNRELQKILYYAQGFHLAQTGEPLFAEGIDAWKFGPVNTTIWHKFKAFGYNSIYRPAKQLVPLDANTIAILTAVVLAFGNLGQTKLIEYSHADRPWASQYIPDANNHISKDSLKDYFSSFNSIDEYLEAAQQKFEFHTLISQRREYLTNLPNIGNEWISGGATSPTNAVCSLAKGFLSGLERFVFARSNRPEIPKIVIGPLPSGGVGIELSISSLTLYTNLWNNGLVEIDMERSNGEFLSKEISVAEFEEDYSAYYEVLAV